ncbi:MAG: ParB/RepB/Spo0J family partition protein [Nitrospinaceae bacterium]|nr:ParB/RepB/Spo0J family partition protein [Nitrospinaceae bacterium]NIR54704.1 ParB/RepB/Spo0J family partition protein [Nitrospinaceae bacterium]NIS85125.1 ParB/RepB/Spo0J family partition protein [Nitrospinaceae bacterium]NIT81942.1 ParB/RepB/Spo0J family partition protein [Nitrospinaceae bacterium]NIU44203.1 ParB/RepB/Spo0J family partition protein [Nitrospinaceae bacterium]
MSRKALGEGIKALIPKIEAPPGENIKEDGFTHLLIDEIVPGDTQPRKDFDDEKLDELVNSIKENGVIQPIIVQKGESNYEIICGERRWRASQKAGFKKIPAIVRQVSNTESLQMALIENIHRQDLNPIEEANAYRRLQQEFGLTQETIAKRVGKNRATVTNFLRLLKLSKPFQEDLVTGRLTMGHARAMLALKSEEDMETARHQVLKKNMNVRQLESYVRKMLAGKTQPVKEKQVQKDIFIKDLEKELERRLGTKVAVSPSKKGGKLVVFYYSNDDLARIRDMIINQQ